jgi:hypothetical protein
MRVDHLVWYCADLERGTRHFSDRFDGAPVYGGVHPGEGTRNSLLSLAEETYVEVLARDPEQPASNLESELRNLNGAGLYHWAAGGVDLEDLRRRAHAAGLEGSDLVIGGRTLPNGERLAWKLFGLRNHAFGALVPFFIDWMESNHPAGAAPRGGALADIAVGHPEPDRLRAVYSILGLDLNVGESPPGLTATVETRRGRQVLSMFNPVPRGFVI